MGKVRRSRTKFHTSAAKDTDGAVEGGHFLNQEVSAATPTLVLPPLSKNPFSTVEISHSDLNQRLDLNNNEIQLTGSNTKQLEDVSHQEEVRLNKKERRWQRRENFLKKLNTAKIEMEKTKSAKKRAKAPVVGDLQPLTLALPDIVKIVNETEDFTKTKRKRRRKPRRMRGMDNNAIENFKTIDQRGIKKIQSKRTQKHMLCEIDRLKKLFSNPSFKNDAEKTVKEMIQSNVTRLKES